MNLLVLRDVSRQYHKQVNTVPAVSHISLAIDSSEFIAIVGPSGSGKTTLLNIIGCLDRPDSGSVAYRGTDLGTLNDRELSRYRKGHISFIFQSYNLIPVLTVRENVELPLTLLGKHPSAEIREKADRMIEAVGLGSMKDRKPAELSGGEEQRVAIARALVKEPLLVLADEPTANLDSVTAGEIIAIMKEMNQRIGTTFIFSTHDPLVEKHAHRVIRLRDGQVEADEARPS